MNKILTTTMFVLCFLTLALAQKKPKLSNAKKAWESGDLATAKDIIDQATTYEKTKDNGDTWYYRGLIYASLDTSSNPEYETLKSESTMQTALDAFKKAEELDTKNKGYFVTNAMGMPILMDQQISGYYAHYFNNAIAAYQDNDFATASLNFEKASIIIPDDTTALSNAGYAAQANEENERALQFFKKSIDLNIQDKNVYYNAISILLQQKKNDEALALIRKGKELFPSDNQLNRQEISILMENGQAEQAKNQLLTAIENEPNDAALKFALGLLYEELKQPEEAKKTYEAALKNDPSHYESNYNLAVIVFKKTNELYKEQSQLGISKSDLARSKELTPKIKEGFQKALPYWERVYELNSEEKPAIETLSFLYSYLGMNEKAIEMRSKLD